MRSRGLMFCALTFPLLVHGADRAAAGRWVGTVQIPGEERTVVLDLDQSAAGSWIGSITIPGLLVKGATVSQIAIQGPQLQFSIASAIGAAPDSNGTFKARLQKPDTLTGTFSQGGNTASFSAKRTGSPQVELPAHNTAVEAGLVGTWRGDYELTGYPRHVTLALTNHPGSAATAELEIVGREKHTLAVDLLMEEEGLLRVEAHELSIAFEGRLASSADILNGTISQGSLEAPIVLRRVTKQSQGEPGSPSPPSADLP